MDQKKVAYELGRDRIKIDYWTGLVYSALSLSFFSFLVTQKIECPENFDFYAFDENLDKSARWSNGFIQKHAQQRTAYFLASDVGRKFRTLEKMIR